MVFLLFLGCFVAYHVVTAACMSVWGRRHTNTMNVDIVDLFKPFFFSFSKVL